jgi:hypothetical protein
VIKNVNSILSLLVDAMYLINDTLGQPLNEGLNDREYPRHHVTIQESLGLFGGACCEIF